jgi:uncharacterized repeat protein (TIGR01451 family)
VTVGADITFTVTVNNAGPGTSTGVTVVDEIADALTFGLQLISASASQGTCSSRVTSGTLLQTSCGIGSLAASATATVTVVVRPTSGFTGPLANSAYAMPATTDPNLNNNSASTATTVTTGPYPSCHLSYPDFCIPPPPPDLDCGSALIAGRKNFTVLHNVANPDPHGLDGDNDGIGCEA